MGQSSEEYIKLCDEWVNLNPITGFKVKDANEKYHGNPDYDYGRYSTPKVIERQVKKKTLLSGLKQN